MRHVNWLWIVLLLAGSLPAPAQYGYGRTDDAAAANQTKRAARAIEREFRRCTQLDRVYRYDCYRFTYDRAANLVANNPDLAPAAEAIDRVRGELGRIVQTNRDPAQPAVRRGGQTFVAVRSDTLPASKAALTEALDEATTILLRADASARRVGFQRIAAAVESNKVLLRSALPVATRLV